MNKKSRGALEDKETRHEQLSAIKWHDNQAVTFITTIASANLTVSVQSWYNKGQEAVEVTCPTIVKA